MHKVDLIPNHLTFVLIVHLSDEQYKEYCECIAKQGDIEITGDVAILSTNLKALQMPCLDRRMDSDVVILNPDNGKILKELIDNCYYVYFDSSNKSYKISILKDIKI